MFSQIRGRVIELNSNGDTASVPGVILLWSHSSINTTTNEHGLFSIKTTTRSNVLLIKATSYKSDSVTISDTTKFITLILKNGVELSQVDVVYETTGTELSYMNPMKTETLNERSLMKAACCNLSESFETNPSVDVNFADAITGTKQIQMLGLS